MYQIGIYLRVSKEEITKEEANNEESQSISGQRNLLQAFICKEFSNEQVQIEEFADDGFTGVNDRRPSLKRMITRVKEGTLKFVKDSKVNCILVKDFSRLARDYLLLGEYMEILFPRYQVRFISVNDGYDSSKYQEQAMGLDMQFRGLYYDLYSKDISCKVKSALRAKKKAGIYVGANTPFGYQKSPFDRHQLVIQKEEAEVVKEIFRLAEEGYGATKIAGKLESMGIHTPKEFRQEKREKEAGHWYPATVWRILRNRVYMGELIQGKYEKEYVGGRSIETPPGQRIIKENNHEKIVSEELFYKVQKEERQGRQFDDKRRGESVSGVQKGTCRKEEC